MFSEGLSNVTSSRKNNTLIFMKFVKKLKIEKLGSFRSKIIADSKHIPIIGLIIMLKNVFY